MPDGQELSHRCTERPIGNSADACRFCNPLVNVYKKRWKDPPYFQWVHPLFRLGHFQWLCYFERGDSLILLKVVRNSNRIYWKKIREMTSWPDLQSRTQSTLGLDIWYTCQVLQKKTTIFPSFRIFLCSKIWDESQSTIPYSMGWTSIKTSIKTEQKIVVNITPMARLMCPDTGATRWSHLHSAPAKFRRICQENQTVWIDPWIRFLGKILTGNHGKITIKLIGLSCKFSHHPILWIDLLGKFREHKMVYFPSPLVIFKRNKICMS